MKVNSLSTSSFYSASLNYLLLHPRGSAKYVALSYVFEFFTVLLYCDSVMCVVCSQTYCQLTGRSLYCDSVVCVVCSQTYCQLTERSLYCDSVMCVVCSQTYCQLTGRLSGS